MAHSHALDQIEKEMRKTLRSVKIIKIEKIQNIVSWNMYSADLGGSMLKNVN